MPARSRTAWRWVAVGVVFVVVAAALTAVLRPDGGAEESTSAGRPVVPASGIAVALSPFGLPTRTSPAGTPHTFGVEAFGAAPVVAVELWAGDEAVDRVVLDPAVPAAAAVLGFTPEAAGAAIVHARAIDEAGHTAVSNVVRLEVVEPDRTAASDRAVTDAELAALPPEVAAAWRAAQGGSAASPPASGATGPVGGAARAVARPRRDRALPPLPDVPLADAPELDVSIDGCTARGRVQSPGGGSTTLMVLGPGDGSFAPVETVDGDATVEAVVGPGSHQFLAQFHADDGAGSFAAPVTVEAPDGCAGDWSGDLRLVDGVLDGADAERAYLYVDTGGRAWQRVPADPGSSVARAGDGFDFGSSLPAAQGGDVRFEAWGRRNGGLVRLGTGRLELANAEAAGAIVGFGTRTSLTWVHPPYKKGLPPFETTVGDIAKPGVFTFRWKTEVPWATHGVWQVSSAPAPVGSAPAPEPPLMLDHGVAFGKGGEFTIDFNAIVDPDAVIEASNVPLGYDQVAGVAFQPGPNAKKLPAKGTLGTAALQVGALEAGDIPDAAVAAAIGTTKGVYYVRVVPMAGDNFLGLASNNVQVTIDSELESPPAPTNVPKGAYTAAVEIDPPVGPNPGYLGCFQFARWDTSQMTAENVTKYGSQYKFWFSFLNAAKAAGGVGDQLPICAGCYHYGATTYWVGDVDCDTSSGLAWAAEQLGEAGVTLWDSIIVKTFYEIKNFAIDTLVFASGCEGWVGNGTSKEKAKEICHAAAEIAVEAAMLYFGIPPNLPDTKQLAQLAKGNLLDSAVELAEDLGIPCEEIGTAGDVLDEDELDCRKALEKLLEEIIEQAETAFAESASGIFGALPPGLVLVPYPASLTTPAKVHLTLTRTAKAPSDGTACPATLLTNASWKAAYPFTAPYPEYNALNNLGGGSIIVPIAAQGGAAPWRVPAGTYSGVPFVAKTVNLPTVPFNQPGGKVTKTYTLANVAPHDAVGASLILGSYTSPGGSKAQLSSALGTLPYGALLLHKGADFGVTFVSSCAGVVTENVEVGSIFSFGDDLAGKVAGSP